MNNLRSDLVEMLRSMARRGDQPSVMLRALVAQLGPETADRPLLVRYFSEAFCFTEGQGYKIFGWFPDGSEGLKDSGIDSLLFKRIQETRNEWDKPGSGQVDFEVPSVKPDIQEIRAEPKTVSQSQVIRG